MMIQITPTLFISADELIYTYIHSSGPGGQNVNKVATSVQLRFDVEHSPYLATEVKARLIRLAGRKINREGLLFIEAKRFRSQVQNRSDAEKRLKNLIIKALVKPKNRRPTKRTKASQEKRIKEKKSKGKIKSFREATWE
jgi:ribosome-associated protein